MSEWHKHNTAPGTAWTGYSSVQAPSARRPHLSFLIISLHLCHLCMCRLLTQSCCRGAFTFIPAHWSPVSVRINARTAGWRLAASSNRHPMWVVIDPDLTLTPTYKHASGHFLSFPPSRQFDGFNRRIPDSRPLSFAGFSLGTVLPLRAARKI